MASLLVHCLYFQNDPCILLASTTDCVELLLHCLLHDSCRGSAFSVHISMLIEQRSTWQNLDSSCPLQVLKPSRNFWALRKYRKLSSSCQTDHSSCLCWVYDYSSVFPFIASWIPMQMFLFTWLGLSSVRRGTRGKYRQLLAALYKAAGALWRRQQWCHMTPHIRAISVSYGFVSRWLLLQCTYIIYKKMRCRQKGMLVMDG